MTSNKGAGFSSAPNRKFDPMSKNGPGGGGGGGGALNNLQRKSDANVEEQTKELERKVHQLLELSASLCADGDTGKGESYLFVYAWMCSAV